MHRRYGKVKMKCGEDDDGRSVRIKLKHFVRYMAEQQVRFSHRRRALAQRVLTARTHVRALAG